ncbi:histidine phosphatase family protein [Mycobacterium sp. PDNC021]|uniref:histidine phosphatase family protein n=1 Tax=Mycobacterium sp. PDNC021 TaxID=3391399 RepID=UPI003AAA244D
MRIALVRHGTTLLNEHGHYQGQCDPPLSPAGERDATGAAAAVTALHWSLVCSSPQLRARATARALLGGTRHPVRILAGLRERHLGDIDGRCRGCVEAESPGTAARLIHDRDYIPPGGGESLEAVRTRALAAAATLAEPSMPDGPVLAVTHGAVIAALTGGSINEVAPLHAAIVDVEDTGLTTVAAGISLTLLPKIFDHHRERRVTT